MEVFCCLIRILQYALGNLPDLFLVTPLSYKSFQLSLTLLYFSYPFTLSSGIFLIFFWIDVTSSTLYHGTCLNRAFWPCVVFIIIAFLIVWVPGILLLAGHLNQVYITITGGFVVFFSLIVAIIFFVAAKRIVKYTKERATRTKELLFMTKKVVLSGVVIVVIVVVCIILLFMALKGMAGSVVYTAFSWILAFLFILRSFLQIEVFSTPKDTKSTTIKTTRSDISVSLNSDMTTSK